MPTQVQFRRGTSAQNNSFTGAAGELSVDSDINTLRLHDGSTVGGHELARADLSNTSGISTITVENIAVTGLSTFTGNVEIGGNLDVDGLTELDATNISETLNVVGVSTFASNVDINAGLDVSDVINSSTDVRVNGVSVLTTASNDALALAIALG